MHVPAILTELVVVLAVSLAVVVLSRKLRVPNLIGFLLAGVLIGPGGLGVISDRHDIEVLAEVGVVLLLFTVGLELSLRELRRMARLIFIGGGAQVGLTIGLLALGGWLIGEPLERALALGMLVALSSTAIVLRLLADRSETGAPHGRVMLGLLLFQDLAIVPLILVIPLLAPSGGEGGEAALAMLQSFGFAALIFGGAYLLLPRALGYVARLRDREVFTLATVLAVLGTAYISGATGLSLALGAFVAGVVLADTDVAHQVVTEIAPFRDVFNSFFFVSIGMLVDPSTWTGSQLPTFGLFAVGIAVKALIIGVIALLFGHGRRPALLSSLGLAQIGEFGFVLATVAVGAGLVGQDLYQAFIAIAVVSMAATPAVLALAAWVGGRIAATGPAAAMSASASTSPPRSGHVVIVGYGINGKNVARVLRRLDVGYVVIELNAASVVTAQAEGEPILYGDATRESVLEHAGIAEARVIVASIDDPSANRLIVQQARRLSPDILVVVRTRYVGEVEVLHDLGAQHVVPEEFETSLALAGLVMEHFGAGEWAVEQAKAELRRSDYAALRGGAEAPRPGARLPELIAAADLRCVTLPPDGALVDVSLKDSAVRPRSGATVVAVRRGAELRVSPPPDFALRADDEIFLFGKRDEVDEAQALLGSRPRPMQPTEPKKEEL